MKVIELVVNGEPLGFTDLPFGLAPADHAVLWEVAREAAKDPKATSVYVVSATPVTSQEDSGFRVEAGAGGAA